MVPEYLMLPYLVSMFLGFGLLGIVAADHQERFPKPLYAVAHVLTNSWAVLVGLVLFITGKRFHFWQPQQNRSS